MKNTAEDLLEELIHRNGEKPRHPNHPDSTFKSKKDYDKAYKEWSRTDNVILKAKGEMAPK